MEIKNRNDDKRNIMASLMADFNVYNLLVGYLWFKEVWNQQEIEVDANFEKIEIPM